MKFITTTLLYTTSWIIRVGIRLRWWGLVHKILEYKKNKLAIKMRIIKNKTNI